MKIHLCLGNTESISKKALFEKHVKFIRINPNISKYWEFRESMVLSLDTKSNMTSIYFTNFFIIIRNCKWEDSEVDADR